MAQLFCASCSMLSRWSLGRLVPSEVVTAPRLLQCKKQQCPHIHLHF